MLLKGDFITFNQTITGKSVLRVVERYGRDQYGRDIVVARNGDLIAIGPESRFQHLWAPEYKAGEKVRIKSGRKNVGQVGTIIDAHYAGEMYYFSVEIDGEKKDFDRDELEKYVPVIHKESNKMSTRIRPDRYAYYVVKKGDRTPAVMIMQLCFNKLVEGGALTADELKVDGIYGPLTEGVVKAMQTSIGTDADGKVGKNTWAAIIDRLPEEWRPPLRLRLMNWMDTYENSSTRKGFSSTNIIVKEGWYNYGVYNVNKGSAAIALRMGSRADLASKIETDPYVVADWFGSSEGIDVQLNRYTDEQVIAPSLANLAKLGFTDWPMTSPDQLPDTFDDPWLERLFVQACDITVNSGAGGFFPKKTPRQWDGGPYPWPADRLPDKEDVKKIYSEEFGQTIPSDYEFVTSDTRDTYAKALKRCLDELCTDNEQKIELIGELQARCVISTWRDLVICRRRSIARAEGHPFQGYTPHRKLFGVC